MRRKRAERGAMNFGCFVWLAIVGLIAYACYIIVPVKVATSNFADFMQEEAGFGSIKSPQQIENEILAKAKELSLPIGKGDVLVRKTRESITVEAHYEITLDFFNGAYKHVWKFDPVFSRPIFNV